MQGIYPIYKPKGPTSHDIIDKLRKITGVKKIGHAGTLDPMAEGVLIVAIGREYTKKIHTYVVAEKEYEAEILLGKTSDTLDIEGEIREKKVEKIPSLEEIKTTLNSFTGKIKQTPPIYSAVKVQGKPAYKLARKGKIPRLKPREVEIKEIDLLSYSYPLLKINVTTGSGVYIRSLAQGIGEKLSTGALLSSLIRKRVGKYTIKKCYSPDKATDFPNLKRNISRARPKSRH